MTLVETVDDLAHAIADLCCAWNAHDAACKEDARLMCRSCFVTNLSERMRNAVANERMRSIALAAGDDA